MTKKLTIHKSERKFDGFLKIDEVTVSYDKYKGGKVKDQKLQIMERGNAVAALIYNVDSNKVILIEQFRYPTYAQDGGWLIETVAGGIAKHEEAKDAIEREVMEEVGYSVQKLVPIQEFYVSPGGTTEKIFLFCAKVGKKNHVDKEASGCASEQEDILRIEVPLKDFFRKLDKNIYLDAKVIIAGHWLRRQLNLDKRRKSPIL